MTGPLNILCTLCRVIKVFICLFVLYCFVLFCFVSVSYIQIWLTFILVGSSNAINYIINIFLLLTYKLTLTILKCKLTMQAKAKLCGPVWEETIGNDNF